MSGRSALWWFVGSYAVLAVIGFVWWRWTRMLAYLKAVNEMVAAIVAGLKEAVALTKELIELQKELGNPVVGINASMGIPTDRP